MLFLYRIKPPVHLCHQVHLYPVQTLYLTHCKHHQASYHLIHSQVLSLQHRYHKAQFQPQSRCLFRLQFQYLSRFQSPHRFQFLPQYQFQFLSLHRFQFLPLHLHHCLSQYRFLLLTRHQVQSQSHRLFLQQFLHPLHLTPDFHQTHHLSLLKQELHLSRMGL